MSFLSVETVECQTNTAVEFSVLWVYCGPPRRRENDYLAMDCAFADEFGVPAARLAITTESTAERALFSLLRRLAAGQRSLPRGSGSLGVLYPDNDGNESVSDRFHKSFNVKPTRDLSFQHSGCIVASQGGEKMTILLWIALLLTSSAYRPLDSRSQPKAQPDAHCVQSDFSHSCGA
jgi:hypothetical protein